MRLVSGYRDLGASSAVIARSPWLASSRPHPAQPTRPHSLRCDGQEHEVLAETLRHGRGRIALADAKGVLGLEESSGLILRIGHQVATLESLERERQMIAVVNRGLGAFERLGGDHAFVASDRLRPDQQHAVHQVLASRDGG
jgi:hypothetical protein